MKSTHSSSFTFSWYATIFCVAFALNLIWENLQMQLYGGYRHFTIFGVGCFLATLWDALFITTLYVAVAIMSKDMLWMVRMSMRQRIMVLLLGLVFAILYEKYALSVERYYYTEAMPIIPLLDVWLTPIIQMLLLSLVTYHITRSIVLRQGRIQSKV